MIVELHMLQNFAPSCLNRDDTNSPKECQFGGYRRARISSQCIKRTVREEFRHSLDLPAGSLATRSKLFVGRLADKLTQAGKASDRARDMAIRAVNTMGLGVTDEDATQYLLYLGEQELNNIAQTVLEKWTELEAADTKERAGKAKTELGRRLKEMLDGGKAVDLALFGRMLADLPDKNRDAACQVAHAFSTNKINVEFDFYTAVDDLRPKEEAGAGMMGTIEFNSACYYRYSNVDMGQLEKNLDGDTDLSHKALEAFVRASVRAIPTGKQTSLASPNPPEFILAVVRESGAWSLANAFARPVWPGTHGNMVQQSISALVDYWNRLVKVYGNEGINATPAVVLSDADLPGLTAVSNLDRLIEEVLTAVGRQGQKGD